MIKKHILIFPFDLLSHYLRCITLAQNYKEYEVLFAYSKKYNEFVKNAGYKSFDVECFDATSVMKSVSDFKFDWLNSLSINKIFKSQVNSIIGLNPFLVIGDNAPTLKMAAEKTNTKFIALMNGYMSLYYDGVRTLSSTHPSYKYANIIPTKVKNSLIAIGENISFYRIHKPFKNLRKIEKLRYVKNYLHELEGDENLICDDINLFPQKKLSFNYKIVGPLMHLSDKKENQLLSLLDIKKPTICVSLGSSGNWNKLKFLSNKTFSILNIIVAGDLSKTLQGSHIFHQDFVNLDEVLPKCKLLICHGGNGTIYTGLKHNLFMLCITSHFEQEWNANRLVELNLGKIINDNPEKYVREFINDFL